MTHRASKPSIFYTTVVSKGGRRICTSDFWWWKSGERCDSQSWFQGSERKSRLQSLHFEDFTAKSFLFLLKIRKKNAERPKLARVPRARRPNWCSNANNGNVLPGQCTLPTHWPTGDNSFKHWYSKITSSSHFPNQDESQKISSFFCTIQQWTKSCFRITHLWKRSIGGKSCTRLEARVFHSRILMSSVSSLVMNPEGIRSAIKLAPRIPTVHLLLRWSQSLSQPLSLWHHKLQSATRS